MQRPDFADAAAQPERHPSKSAMRRLLIALALLAVTGIAGILFIGDRLAAPYPQAVGVPPPDLPAESVLVPVGAGQALRGWFVAGETSRSAVLLLHGVRASRRDLIGRARFLHRAGYAILMIDFQAHGESQGEAITFGYLESRDARAAVRYLRQRLPGERVGVIGMSLGAASSLVGEDPLPVDALVLEAVYASLDEAVRDRLAIRLGGAGRLLAPLLLWQVGPRLGFDPEALSPIDRIADVGAPVLLVGGSEDRRAPASAMRRLFERAPEPKALWMIEGARHQDFHRFAPRQYESRVLAFLGRYLR